MIEPLLGTLAVMIFFFFAFRNYGGVPMDLKELFELVGMAGTGGGADSVYGVQ